MGGWIGGWVEERTGGPNARVARARGRGRPAAGGPNAWAAQAGEHGRMYLAGRAGCPNAWAAQAGERGRQGERAVGARRRFHRRALPAPGPRVATLSAGRQARGRGGGRGVGKKPLENTSDCGAIPSASKKGGSETYVLCGEGVGGRGRVGKRGEGRGPEEQLSASSPQALYSRTLQVPKAMVAAELAFGTLSKLRKP